MLGSPGWQSNKPAAAAMSHHGMVKPDPDEYNELSGSGHWATASGHYHDHHGQFDHSVYHTPNLKRSRSDRSGPSTPDNTQSKYYRRWPSETETADSIPISDIPSESTELDDDNDISKLKGVRYPGMGLFDSADETQKRMRNQRKDDSVLKHMEETSSGIVPNEFVWTENGEFQRIRDIYASPSIEGSPVRHCHIAASFQCCSNSVPQPRTANSRIAMPPSQSEAAVPPQARQQPVHAPRAESLGQRHLGTSVLTTRTRSWRTKMTIACSPALLVATTSFGTLRSAVPVCRASGLERNYKC